MTQKLTPGDEMTIDRAIELLEEDYRNWSSPYTSDLATAQRLGLEALRVRKLDREHGYVDLDDLLPGETQEPPREPSPHQEAISRDIKRDIKSKRKEGKQNDNRKL